VDNKEELLEKVIVSTEIGNPAGSGLLNAAQSDRFIDYMWDATVLGSQVRTIRMTANEVEIDKIGVGQRLLRGATEAVDTGENQGVIFSKLSLTTKKLRLDWEISTESLEDNIEGEALEDHIARLMATQAGNDLEDLAINGDKASTDPLLRVFDGWRKIALEGNEEGAAHVLDHGGQGINRALFNRALKKMPRKFMQQRPALRFLTGSGVIQDYLFSLADGTSGNYIEAVGNGIIANGPVRTQGPAGYTTGQAFGIPLQEVPKFDEFRTGTYSGATGEQHADVWLTDPKNLIWAVKREIQVFREFRPKKDTTEFTVFTRVGVGVENTDAFVVTTNLKLAD